MSKPKTVRLYPVPGVSLYPWPSEPFDATEAEARFLLAVTPPPFSTDPPDPPPTAETTQPTDPPEGGSSDSEAP